MSINIHPVYRALYRAGPKAKHFERVEMVKIQLQQLIEPAQTECAAPIVFALKKAGSLCFGGDYWRFNVVAKWNSYQVLLIDACIDCLGEATGICTLDANSGYWEDDGKEAERDETACDPVMDCTDL